jgi:hypothetical protein
MGVITIKSVFSSYHLFAYNCLRIVEVEGVTKIVTVTKYKWKRTTEI